MKRIVFLATILISTIASAGMKNILPTWMTSDSVPQGTTATALPITLPMIGGIEIKAMIINQQTFDQDKPVNRLVISTKDEVNEYFFVLAENAQVTKITSLKQSSKSPNVIEVDAVNNKNKTLQFNFLLTSTRRFSAEPGHELKLFQGIVLFDQQGYRRQ